MQFIFVINKFTLSIAAATTPSFHDTHSLDLTAPSQPEGQATMKPECILYWLTAWTNYITATCDRAHTGGREETTWLPY